jgi:hypothetical protein
VSILIRLKFTQNFAPYKKGDVAGFVNEVDADKFLSAKRNKKPVAKEVKGAPEDKAVKSAEVTK